jgi:hypothetical protein
MKLAMAILFICLCGCSEAPTAARSGSLTVQPAPKRTLPPCLLESADTPAGRESCRAFHVGFRSGFKESFMPACLKKTDAGPAARAYCGCAEALIEKKYTDAQIAKLFYLANDLRAALKPIMLSCRPTS